MIEEGIGRVLETWIDAWNAHDLDGVMELLHDEVVFENWDGRAVRGKRDLRRAWTGWFEDHGDFRFVTEEIFVDGGARKALFMWRLDWPSREEAFEGEREERRGVDVLYFEDGKIIRKLTYSKTTVEIGGRKIELTAGGSRE